MMRNAYTTSVETPEGKRPLGRHKRRWADNIKMYLNEIGLEGVDWIYLVQDRDRWRGLVNTFSSIKGGGRNSVTI
jgi:hypothetical protein